MDAVELMDRLAERGCSVVLKADGERPPGLRWMVIASGGALGEDGSFRTDRPSPEACLNALLEHLEGRNLFPFA
ncbi:hypothetical protein ACFY00_17290 [Kitasatospora sp. NPDC001540]|uniref:hypothetical protein n=1 Tax=Kitasatospora sp. NPDC001540 TaxID=3364014 RepID=UPI0036C36432